MNLKQSGKLTLTDLELSGIRMELISFITESEKDFPNAKILFHNFVALLEDSFLTRQDYKEFLEEQTRIFINQNL